MSDRRHHDGTLLHKLFSWTMRLCLVLAASGAHAADDVTEGHYLFRSYGPLQGLPDVGVLALLQDRAGFIWAATENGLYRYDGHRFDVFGLRDGLRSIAITVLYEDASGTLWIGTRAGVHRWDGRRFVAAALQDADGRDASGIEVAGISGDRDGLWLATASGPFARTAAGFVAMRGWPGGAATAVHRDAATRHTWVARWDGHPALFRERDGAWSPADFPDIEAGGRLDALAGDGDGQVWARQQLALSIAPRDTGRFVPADLSASLRGRLAAGRGHLVAGRRGDVWVPLDTGVLHYERGQWRFIDLARGLPTTWTRAVLEDRDGSLWVGSVGLHRLLHGGLFRGYTIAEGLQGNTIWCIVRDRARRLWIGGAGLAQLTATGASTIPGTEYGYVRSVVEIGNGDLVMGGAPGDYLLAYTPGATNARRIPFGAYAPTRVLRLAVGRDGALWAATDDAGLLRAGDAQAPRFARAELPGGDAREFIGDVAVDAQGRVWAAGRNGLAILEKDTWRRFTIADGLRRDFVAYLRPTRDGGLLVGYFDPLGIAQVRYTGGRFEIVRHIEPPSVAAGTNNIYMIGEDARGRLWVGSGNGVDRLDADGWRHYGVADGLVGEDVNNMAFLAEDDGDVWIGTSAGIARYDSSREDAAGQPPAPAVTLIETRLGARTVDTRATHAAAPREDNRFAVRYAALSYVDEVRREYRTRLVGLDDGYAIGTGREQDYAGLRHGRYRFEVAARIGGGAWGPTTAFAFEIRPAWWQTGWALALFALAAVALLTLAVRRRVAVLHARNRALEGNVAARTAELRTANVRLSALNEEERRRAQRFRAIARTAALISSNLDRDTLLQQTADALHEVLEFPNVDIPLLTRDDPPMLVARIRGGRYKAQIQRDDYLPIDRGIMGSAVRERRVQCVNDTSADPRYVQPHGIEGSRAELAVPILTGREVLGVLNVEGDGPFDELDVASLTIIADYLAVAIENARLFDEAQEAAVLAERRRVAHDLHDNVTQILSSINLQAQSLAQASGDPAAPIARRADRVAELARLAVGELRAFLSALRPSDALRAAPSRSLAEAVRDIVGRMVPDGIAADFDFARYAPQTVEHEEALLRVIQEAASNAVRHAGATALHVTARVDADSLHVSIDDDGRGMSPRQEGDGLGLTSMRVRVEALGGTLRMTAAEPHGTRVIVWLPRADREA